MFLIYVGVFFCRHYNECTLQGSIVIVAMLINIHVFFCILYAVSCYIMQGISLALPEFLNVLLFSMTV